MVIYKQYHFLFTACMSNCQIHCTEKFRKLVTVKILILVINLANQVMFYQSSMSCI